MPLLPSIATMLSLPLTIMVLFTATGANAARRGKKLERAEMARYMPWFTICGFVASGLLGLYFVSRYTIDRAALGLVDPARPVPLLVGLAVGVIGALLWYQIMRRPPERTEDTEDTEAPATEKKHAVLDVSTPLLLMMGVCAGIFEEWVFRGAALAMLESQFGLVTAAVITTVVFGIAHFYQGLRGILMTGVIGGIFLALLLTTASLPAAMLAHAAWDVTMILRIRRTSRESNGS